MRGLDLVWESATPPTHIWEKYPKKKRFFYTFPKRHFWRRTRSFLGIILTNLDMQKYWVALHYFHEISVTPLDFCYLIICVAKIFLPSTSPNEPFGFKITFLGVGWAKTQYCHGFYQGCAPRPTPPCPAPRKLANPAFTQFCKIAKVNNPWSIC